MEIWYKTICHNCQKVNWISQDPNDSTVPDIETVECYNCRYVYWLDEEFGPEVANCDIEDAFGVVGEPGPS